MKKIFTLLFFVSAISVTYAQEQPELKAEEKIQAMEVGYISQKLNLTTEEAQKFWPIYNDYKRDVREVMKSYRNNPDADILEKDKKIIDIKMRYRDRFTSVIGQPRVRTFFQAEGDFRRALMNRLKNNPQRPMLQRRGRN